MEHFYSLLLQWAQFHGLWGVAAFMAVESGGMPFPTELGFITAQGMLGANLCPLWKAYVWIVGGHLVGAGVSYHLGRAGDSALCRYLSHRPSVIAAHEKVQRWYARYGAMAVLFGRLVGQVRPWSSFLAGLARVPALTFWLWTILGTMIFTAVAMWMTAVGFKYWQAHREMGVPIVVVLMVIFYGLPVYKGLEQLVKHLKRRRLAHANKGC